MLQAAKFEFVINLHTAKLLDLEVPTTLLARSSNVATGMSNELAKAATGRESAGLEPLRLLDGDLDALFLLVQADEIGVDVSPKFPRGVVRHIKESNVGRVCYASQHH